MKKNFYFNRRSSASWLRSFSLGIALTMGAVFNAAMAQRISTTGGTYTINATGTNTGTNFTTFTDAINDLNFGATFTGNIIINVTAGQAFNENTPVITATGSGTGAIIFQRSGAGANPVINSLGTTTSLTDAGITIQGGDYFTFNGINITAADSSLEFGYLIRKGSGTDGANFNTVTNATIILNKLKLTSYGVLQTTDSLIVAQTGYGSSSLAGTNSNNTYTNLTIGNSFNGIWLKGMSNIYRDSNNTANNNTIGRASVTDDIGGTSTSLNTYGIYGSYQNLFTANANTVQNATSAYYLYCIYSANSVNVVHNNNTITAVKNTASYYYVYCIYLSGVTGATVNNNAMRVITAGSSTYLYGVYLATVSGVTVSGNTLDNVNAYVAYGFYGATITATRVSGNTVNNFNGTSTAYAYYMGTSTSSRLTANTATNLNGGTTYLFYMSGGSLDSVDHNSANNIIANGTMYCLYTATTTTFRVYNNTVTNASNNGIVYTSYHTTPNNSEIHDNTFRNIKSSGTGTFYTQYTTALTGTNLIYNNTYSDLGATNAASTANVYGMYFTNATSGTVINKIYNNVINGLIKTYTGSATATRYLHGLYFATTSNSSCSYEIVHNSVSINGSAAPNSSSQVIYTAPTSSSSPVITMRNNIFANLTGAQSGLSKHYLIWANGTGLIGGSSSSSNYNDWFLANTTNGYFGYSSSDKADIAAWRATAGFTSYEANSVTGDPLFNSALNSRMTFGSPVVNTGSFISGYTLDILGALRNTSAPSMGAYEIPKDETAPVISYAPLLNVYSTANNALPGFATITDNQAVASTTGVAPRIYYKTKTNANAFVGNTAADNGWKWAEAGNASSPFDFTIDYSILPGGAVSVGDTIQYFVVAQDTAGIANVSANPSAGFAATSVASVTSAPSAPNIYVVFGPPAAYTGAAATQPSLSKVGQGSSLNIIVKVAVTTAATGSPAYVSQLGFTTSGGGNDSANIAGASVYYTGTNPVFNTSALFGTTMFTPSVTGPVGAFNVAGNQLIPNGTSYFWLVYTLRAGAVIGDSVGGTLASVTYAGTSNAYSGAATSGCRTIRAEYCASAATSTGDEEILGVAFGTLNNPSACFELAPGPNSAASLYANYTTLPATNVLRGSSVPFSLTLGECLAGTYTSSAAIYIDWNANGNFTDPGELAYNALNFTGALSTAGGLIKAGNVNIPCDAAVGETRMRIVYYETGSLPSSCGAPAQWGETEDYVINIQDNPVAYVSSSAVQNTGVVAPGTLDAQILRIPVKAQGCGTGIMTDLYFNTSGTTLPADILSAKLYVTGNSPVFNTAKLLGTVSSPSGSFVFPGLSDTLLTTTNDTNNYWLAYDISGGATLGNVVHARIDSLHAVGVYAVPVNNNPAGNRQINAPMTYTSSTVTQPDINKVERGSVNNSIVRLVVVTSAVGSPVNVTSLDINTNGTDSLPDIANLKVWYTGNSSVFATTTQFGTTVANPAAMQTVTGTQGLVNGNNYFWVSYDISAAAAINHFVDAEITSATVSGSPQIPTVTAPAGNRQIRNPYCASAAYYNTYEDIGQVMLTQNAATVLSNGSCSPVYSNNTAVNQYTNYTALPATNIVQSSKVDFSICAISGTTSMVGSYLAIYIDYNQDGSWDAGELVYTSPGTTSVTTTFTGSFIVPCTALPGQTRMRVVLQSYNIPTLAAACYIASGNYYYGETEDYTLNIVPNPVAYVSSSAIQNTTIIAPGTADAQILRIPVKAAGCGAGITTSMYFNTSGTTLPSDIASAKLYATGNTATFNTSRLLGSVSSPNGSFSFTGLSDTLLTGVNDTNNYWLTYDITGGAILNNVVHARIDSINTVGIYVVPANNNPAGSRQIIAPMTYVNSTVSQTTTSKVEAGSANNVIVGMVAVTSATGSPVNITSLDINTNGTDSLPDITNLKVWYTGGSSTFATTTQFGATVANPASMQTVTGLLSLANGNNYFWITYDIASNAALGHAVDAEITSSTIAGLAQIPTVTAPAGNRKIRAAYCASAASSTADEDIMSVTFGTMTNTSGCSGVAPGPNSVASLYSNYTTLPAVNILRGTSVPFSLTLGECNTGTYTSSAAIYIDWNANGNFTDPGELTYSSLNFTGTLSSNGGMIRAGSVNVPCDASLGETRMRIVYYETASLPSSCGTPSSWGETEDYAINVQDNPVVYASGNTIQVTDVVAPLTNDAPVLRIPVRASGCGIGTVTEMYFNTSGTSVTADITAAKLYATGNTATFNTARLLGSVSSPNGSFSFTGLSDTLFTGSNDTNNYWLAFDISGAASTGDLIDARIDSIYAVGGYRIPANNNPAGYRLVEIPMTYISSTTSQPDLSKVEAGSANNVILRYEVATSATGAPIVLSSLDINTTGTVSPADITNLKVWYTGTSAVFATTSQFGTTLAIPAASQTVSGTQPLTNGTNYFWVTYDIPGTATLGNVVDGEITSATIGLSARIPAVTAPSGSRQIRAAYCASYATTAATYEDIGNVTLVSGGVTVLNNGIATPTMNNPAAINGYTNFTTLAPAQIYQGQMVNLSVAMINSGAFTYNVQAAVYVDYNQNGSFADANEMVWNSTTYLTALTGPFTGSFTLPASAFIGQTRMRVVLMGGFTTTPLIQANACGTYTYGETEDYVINILPLPASSVYTWNRTGTADFSTASNWTPARTTPLSNDILMVNGGGSVIMSNVSGQNVKAVYLSNNTNATLQGSANFRISDTLSLGAGSSLTSGLPVTLGTDTNTLGILDGAGKYSGTMSRWTNSGTASYSFPLAVGANSRALTLTYSTPGTTAGTITVKYTPGAPGGGGLPTTDASLGLSLVNIADAGIWEITNTNGLTGGTFDALFYADAIGGALAPSQTAMVYRSGGFGSWAALGTATPTTGTPASMILNRTGYSAYGQFGIAGTSSNPLPVTIVSFTAAAASADAIVSWTTASETNNKGFEVERSADGHSFEKAGFVKGAGNSSAKLSYSLTDAKAFTAANSNTLYYRLKQIDFDGRFTYSNMVRVSRTAEKANALSAYPNPFNDSYKVSFDAANAGLVTITMLDIQGRLVTEHSAAAARGINQVSVENMDQLHAGVYFIHVTVDGETQVLKLVKN